MAKTKEAIKLTSEQKSAFANICAAADIAKELFGDDYVPTVEVTLGIHDRVYCFEDEPSQDAVIEELQLAKELATKHFGKADPEMVFGIYDRVLDESDDEDEDKVDEE